MVSHPSIARVALAIPVRELFDYDVPPAFRGRIQAGSRVRVPVGNSRRVGYCVELTGESRHPERKAIDALLDDEPILDAALLELVRWTADYYLAPIGEVVEAAVPRVAREGRPRHVPWVRLTEAPPSPQRGVGRAGRERLLDALAAAGGRLPRAELLERAEVGAGPLRTLAAQGAITIEKAPPPAVEVSRAPTTGAEGEVPELTRHQRAAVERIRELVEHPAFGCFLLEGVTGSGKTEVYLRLVRAVLERGRGALVLVPEISLTPQTVARFQQRVGEAAILHSLLPATERAEQYRRLRAGELHFAIGARSAVFAPVRNLALIIVDESHEPSYKQESSPRYHARDVAIVRAAQLGVPCVLGTATPSYESLHNARRRRFEHVLLPERVGGRALARVEVVDRRREKKPGLLSPPLLRAIDETLSEGGQGLLFLNRRGFARHLHCPSCGLVLRCAACSIGLTWHKGVDRALCHYCGSVTPIPRDCPDCGTPGMGSALPGTERLEETLGRCFPGVAIDRLDRDTATSGRRLAQILERFRKGETRLLAGTQMIAKGHDIPGVTLVGVLDADVALSLPDFRAAERTCSLLCQVAGRAGRGERPGRVIIQTRQPDHYAIEAARRQDLGLLYERELPTRKALGYPPYGHLVRTLVEDPDELRARGSAEELAERLRGAAPPECRVLGPAPAPLARLRGRYRWHLLLLGGSRRLLRQVVAGAVAERPRFATSRRTVDVDPQSLL